MEVISHGYCESRLQHGGDYEKFAPQHQHSRNASEHDQRHSLPEKALQSASNHPQVKPELRERRGQCRVIARRVQTSQRARQRLGRPLEQWSANSGDNEDTEKTELETGSEQRSWIDNKQGQCCCADGVEN